MDILINLELEKCSSAKFQIREQRQGDKRRNEIISIDKTNILFHHGHSSFGVVRAFIPIIFIPNHQQKCC
jgi:hypothetical protein